MQQLSKGIEIRYVGAAVSAGSSINSNSTRVDTANWEGVIFVTTITDSVATGVATLTIEQNTADSDTGMAALTGGAATATSSTNDDLNGKTLIASVHRPRERYVQAVRTSATANIAYGEVYAILYSPRVMPTAEASTTANQVHTVSPAEA